jgi:hypothetical protein
MPHLTPVEIPAQVPADPSFSQLADVESALNLVVSLICRLPSEVRHDLNVRYGMDNGTTFKAALFEVEQIRRAVQSEIKAKEVA